MGRQTFGGVMHTAVRLAMMTGPVRELLGSEGHVVRSGRANEDNILLAAE